MKQFIFFLLTAFVSIGIVYIVYMVIALSVLIIQAIWRGTDDVEAKNDYDESKRWAENTRTQRNNHES